ncbi:hypothetical protein BX661DRAFT_191175 [Kickxella alabastrina]|uniref:uncharacterized protein n=1 Tax=Kickxella alabastrina TaxID=61397 RepID=UPI00221FF509|nr:uncharacterized protein BX661DRAFT_191175 [Kickxella alabastrina]KAI7818831.1 hypothetical protein BX661DRAFT_191175 [Kickxella alabastrina]
MLFFLFHPLQSLLCFVLFCFVFSFLNCFYYFSQHSIQFDSIQFNSIRFNSIQFNSR